MKNVLFIIPVYMNEGSIKLTFEKVSFEVNKLGANLFKFNFLFINDGSKDNSLKEIKELSKSNPSVDYLSFSKNFGQVPAIVAGMKEAEHFDAAIVMSADLQDPPELILSMIDKWQNDHKVVICHRMDRDDDWISKFTSKIFYSLIKVSNTQMPSGGFDFILLDKNAIKAYNLIDERNRFFQGDILWLGFKRCFIPYQRIKREIGKSQWSIRKKIKYFIDGFLNTSYLPIRFISLLGVFTSISGFLYAIIIAANKYFNNTPFKGWAPIMILILVIGGLIMVMLGIIGEYVWRIYDESRNRPYYLIEERSDPTIK